MVLGDGLDGIWCGLALKKTIRRFDGGLDTTEDRECEKGRPKT